MHDDYYNVLLLELQNKRSILATANACSTLSETTGDSEGTRLSAEEHISRKTPPDAPTSEGRQPRLRLFSGIIGKACLAGTQSGVQRGASAYYAGTVWYAKRRIGILFMDTVWCANRRIGILCRDTLVCKEAHQRTIHGHWCAKRRISILSMDIGVQRGASAYYPWTFLCKEAHQHTIHGHSLVCKQAHQHTIHGHCCAKRRISVLFMDTVLYAKRRISILRRASFPSLLPLSSLPPSKSVYNYCSDNSHGPICVTNAWSVDFK